MGVGGMREKGREREPGGKEGGEGRRRRRGRGDSRDRSTMFNLNLEWKSQPNYIQN